MTKTDQYNTWQTFNVFQAKIERKYIPMVYKEINSSLKDFTSYMANVGYQKAASTINTNFDVQGLLTIINDLHKECGGKYGAFVYNQFKNFKRSTGQIHYKRLTLFGVAEDIGQLIVNQIAISLLNNVHGIEASIKDDILHYVELGQINGWAYDKTAKMIEDKVGSKYRSQRIVRTESVKASNMGGMAGAQRTGLLMDKIWINAKDLRVRGNPIGKYPLAEFDHWDMGGQTQPLNQPFHLGSRRTGFASDSLQFPGDPTGAPADIINCRCVAGYIPRRDENGLPIRIAGIPGTFKKPIPA